MSSPVAISLGSSYCCVAFFKDGRSHVISNPDGERLTPTCISFGEEMVVGTQARTQLIRNRANTLVDFLLLLGKKSLKEIENKEVHWPQNTIIEENGDLYFEVTLQGKQVKYTPEDVTAFMLQKMRETAETYLGHQVQEVVISIPSITTEEEQQSLLRAALKAKLNIQFLIKGCIASLLPFGIGQSPDEMRIDKTILVFDVGGNFLDISLIKSFGGLFQIVSSVSERVGGNNYDQCLVDHFAKEFERKNKVKLGNNQRAFTKMRLEMETLKRTLSSSPSYSGSLDSLHEGIDFQFTANRNLFDLVCSGVHKKISSILLSFLQNNSIQLSDIHEVILTGGATNIPSLQSLIETQFSSSIIRKELSPEETIVRGAVLQASVLEDSNDNENENEKMGTPVSVVSLPQSIGILDATGKIIPIIVANSPLPIKRKKTFMVKNEVAKPLSISIQAGETCLGVVVLNGVEETAEVEVELSVSEDGHVKVSVMDLITSVQVTLDIPR